MKWQGTLWVLAAVASLATAAAGHPKHEHKVMGTLSAVGQHEIEVETAEGQKLAIAISDETVYARGDAAAGRADMQVGSRVVVFYMQDEEKVKRAVRILLPERSGAGPGGS